jgi:hypothetical protein
VLAAAALVAILSLSCDDDVGGPAKEPPEGPSHATWRVNADGSGDVPTIQAAIDTAAVGDTVLVGPGRYTDANPTPGGFPANVYLYKNVILTAAGPADSVILDGSANGLVVYATGVDQSAVVRGFRITTEFPGYVCAPVAPAAEAPAVAAGIGVWCQGAGVTIRENHIIDHAIGVWLIDSNAHLQLNTIERCMTGVKSSGVDASDGGANEVFANTMDDCGAHITGDGTRLSIVGNDISAGCAGVDGIDSELEIRENHFADLSGFAVHMTGSYGTVEANVISASGGGIYSTAGDMNFPTDISGNLLAGLGQGVALDNNADADIELFSNTFVEISDSYAVRCDMNSSPEIYSNLIANCFGGVACVRGSAPAFSCNNVFNAETRLYGGDCSDQTGVNGNISADPMFCAPASYELDPDSPCAPGNHPDGVACGLIGARPVCAP